MRDEWEAVITCACGRMLKAAASERDAALTSVNAQADAAQWELCDPPQSLHFPQQLPPRWRCPACIPAKGSAA